MTLEDSFTTYAHEMEERNKTRYLNGECWGCGAKFLIGLKEAEVQNNDASAGYYLCFWCCDDREPDDPTPPRFHYGRA